MVATEDRLIFCGTDESLALSTIDEVEFSSQPGASLGETHAPGDQNVQAVTCRGRPRSGISIGIRSRRAAHIVSAITRPQRSSFAGVLTDSERRDALIDLRR